jgi:hypothetical protein
MSSNLRPPTLNQQPRTDASACDEKYKKNLYLSLARSLPRTTLQSLSLSPTRLLLTCTRASKDQRGRAMHQTCTSVHTRYTHTSATPEALIYKTLSPAAPRNRNSQAQISTKSIRKYYKVEPSISGRARNLATSTPKVL